MLAVKIIICKIAKFILTKMGRGSSFPGELGLKLDKNMIKKMELPPLTICITGSTGKTTISGALTNIFEAANMKVGTNLKGSNLTAGVLSVMLDSCTIFGKTKADVLVLELDERYAKYLFKQMTPNYFIVNNLTRDQSTRNGHCELMFEEIQQEIAREIHLVLNADDPLVTKLSIRHEGPITYYGVSKTKQSKKETLSTLDFCYCPKCHTKLKYDYFQYSNMGKYACTKCDYKRPDVEYEAKIKDGYEFGIDGQTIKMDNNAIYNVYNLSAAYALAVTAGVKKETVTKALNNLSLTIKRIDDFVIGTKNTVILASKPENPMSYNQILEYICTQDEEKTIVLALDLISTRYPIQELSWLYDVYFEILKDQKNTKIICIGKFAYDLALRLKYAEVSSEKIDVYESTEDLIEVIKNQTIGKVYAVLPFDIEKPLKKKLNSGGNI